MALNPVLKIEGKLQEMDQTRFDASKSFITKGETALTSVKIKPGDDATAVEVFTADPETWFLDWAWPSFKIDVSANKNKIKFKRVSTGVTYTASITNGTYTLATLQTELLAKLNLASAVVWTVALSLKNEFTLTANERVEIQSTDLDASLLPYLGFLEVKTDIEFKGLIIEWLPRNITLTLSSGTPVSQVFTQKVYSVAGDALFSSDEDLVTHEPDILDWVSQGRNSFLDAHRRSQEKIMQWIDQNGYLSNTGKRITKWQILDIEDVRLWSVYLTLHHLFMGFQNSKDDVLKDKAEYYEKLMIASRETSLLDIDFNETGKIENEERVTTFASSVVMR